MFGAPYKSVWGFIGFTYTRIFLVVLGLGPHKRLMGP